LAVISLTILITLPDLLLIKEAPLKISPPTPIPPAFTIDPVVEEVLAVVADKFKDVPEATPMFGVVNEGEVAKTIAPVPVGVTAVPIVIVPEEVIAPVVVRNEGTDKVTEVTVPRLKIFFYLK
jgi:hypothetical protein